MVEAARIVAESTPQVPTGNHSDVAGSIREKYSHKLADSYRPPKLQRPEGGLSRYGDGIETSSNESSHHVIKRDYGFWMADMAQLGSSPYAPSGYKVRCLHCLMFKRSLASQFVRRVNIAFFRFGGMLRTLAP